MEKTLSKTWKTGKKHGNSAKQNMEKKPSKIWKTGKKHGKNAKQNMKKTPSKTWKKRQAKHGKHHFFENTFSMFFYSLQTAIISQKTP